MGKMYTLQPDESINDHVKESMSIIDHIVELSISGMRDLAIPHESTFVDMTFNKFMRSLKHIRESIQMLDELCDELEDDKDEIRHEYEEKVIQFFNRFMNFDLTDEHNCREGELARLVHQLDKRCFELNKELEQERKKSNQLEEQLTVLKSERDLAKKLAKKLIDEKQILKHDLIKSELECKNLKVVLDKKYAEIEELAAENHKIDEVKFERDKLSDSVIYWRNLAKTLALYGIHATKETYEYYLEVCKNEYIDTDIAHMYPKTMIKSPCNFCGNCKYFTTHLNDVATCNNKHADLFIVDPDDASCPHFEPTYDTRVVIGKPEFPCCDHCSRDDCDNCTLCPF